MQKTETLIVCLVYMYEILGGGRGGGGEEVEYTHNVWGGRREGMRECVQPLTGFCPE